ncbi:MAG: hypothetical protein K0R69_492 [Clostridia bacterium]|nr:hypothetical protein [Clostridia bacterium]
MNRYEFIGELRNRLKRLPEEEQQEAINYYEEYFDEAAIGYDPINLNEIGRPAVIASEILAQTAVRHVEAYPKSPKSNASAIGLIIVAILGAPIALPLALALVAVVCALIAAIGAVVLALCLTIVALGVSGVAMLVVGFIKLAVEPATGVVFMGMAMLFIGITLLVIVVIQQLLTRALPAVIYGVRNILGHNKKGEKR